MKLVPCAAFALCLMSLVGTAHAQMDSREGIALQNQILELRAQLQQVQQSQGGYPQGPSGYQPAPMTPPVPADQQPGYNSQAGNDTAAQLVVRVSSLEDQVRELQGKVDDLTNQLQRQSDQFTKQLSDLQFKLGQGSPPSAGGNLGDMPNPDQPSAPPPQAAAPQHPMVQPVPAHRTAEAALHEGNAALARRDYPSAAAAAREVLASRGVRSGDAQLLLARAESGQHQFREAAADYYQAYNHAPHAGSAPVALLGVANALIDMNDTGDACQALHKFSAEFPHPAGGLRAAAESAKKRAACR